VMAAKPDKQERVCYRRAITNRADFHFKVPARSDRKHSWKQHADADSYLYQILGRWENLAAMNHGFVHETTATTAKNAHHYRQNDAPVKRVVQRIKKFLREKGIISEEVWGTNRWGHRVRGFYLAEHATCCRTVNGFHVTPSEYNRQRVAERWQIRDAGVAEIVGGGASESQQSRTEVAVKSHQHDFEVAPHVAVEVAPAPVQAGGSPGDTRGHLGLGRQPSMWSGSQEPYEPYEPYEPRHETKDSLRSPFGRVTDLNHKSDEAFWDNSAPWYETWFAASKIIDKRGGDGLQLASLIARLCRQKNGEWPRTLEYYLAAEENGVLQKAEEWELDGALESATDRLHAMAETVNEQRFLDAVIAAHERGEAKSAYPANWSEATKRALRNIAEQRKAHESLILTR
jgi:hypothetical protein